MSSKNVTAGMSCGLGKLATAMALCQLFVSPAVLADNVAVATPAPTPVIAAPQPVASQPATTGHTSVVADEIASINERIAILQAKLGELELKAKIAAKEDEINKARSSPTQESGSVLSVMHIDGIDSNLSAKLLMSNGTTQVVRMGDKVGTWKVKDIKMDSVTLARGKEISRFGLGSYAPQSSGLNGPGSPMTANKPPM